MNDVSKIWICCSINFKKAIIHPRIYIILLISIIYEYFTFSCMPQICKAFQHDISPWVFPFFLSMPVMFSIYGGLAILFYCDAPFVDGHTPFLVVRCGKRNWILGQILYIWLSSFLYTLFHVAISILICIPYVSFSLDWGTVLLSIEDNFEWITNQGIIMGTGVNTTLMNKESPLTVMIVAILLFWAGCVFIGTLIMSCRIWFENMLGIVISAFLTGLAYFACYFGLVAFGQSIYFVSPIMWTSVNYLDWYGIGGIPTPKFALSVFGILILFFSLISLWGFSKKDMIFVEDNYG